MTTETDDLNYYEHDLPKIIAGVRRGEKWEYRGFNGGPGWVQPATQHIDALERILNERVRVRLAPVPVVKWWDCASDVPVNCWIRSNRFPNSRYFATMICADGIWAPNGCGNHLFSWARLSDGDMEHSTDLVHWSPCVKPEGGK